jgi:hypothetical protein
MTSLLFVVDGLQGRPWFSSEWTAGDFFIGLSRIVLNFSAIEFICLVIVAEALGDISDLVTLARFMVNLIDQKQLKGPSTRSQIQTMELDSCEQVDVYHRMWLGVIGYFRYEGFKHAQALAVMSLVSLVSAGVSLMITLLDFPVRYYSVLLLAVGFSMLLIMAIVFVKLVSAFEILTKRVIIALRAQSTRNVLLQTDKDAPLSEAENEKLDMANKRIDAMIMMVYDSPAIKLFGILPMTKSNILKLLGGILAALFSTLIRQVLNY